ncbi:MULTISPECIES: AbrB/MazE/SpoVT family DNA-binding domain-containing protein [Bacillus cereus group]|uniref:Transition state regulator Abh n=1 Tax=Bacillus thuringiensis TaxID=1428 RepID=A0A9X7AQQ1_BACTU|nr:AbrB/MazE/SpoVT family DNA-binding domain-containing protein [Bacillus thuringiensis]MCQ6336236.1 AbrB/MazE/SpoVT family DNA-binding domain-containing protein [Bacillus cereus]PFT49050.1 transition state regulator Abh [Bacillus thuringiensis]
MNDPLFKRKMDAHGRITIPQDLRMRMGMQQQDEIDIYPMHNHLILKKRIPTCFITGKPTLYPFSFLKGKLLIGQEGVQVLQTELENYHQTHMKLAMESSKTE